MHPFDYYDVIGLLGAFLTVSNYAVVQWRRDYAKTLKYSTMNAIASVLVCFSLYKHFNLSSVFINIFWFFISMYGIYRCLKFNRRATEIK